VVQYPEAHEADHETDLRKLVDASIDHREGLEPRQWKSGRHRVPAADLPLQVPALPPGQPFQGAEVFAPRSERARQRPDDHEQHSEDDDGHCGDDPPGGRVLAWVDEGGDEP